MAKIYSVRIIAADFQLPERAVNLANVWPAPLYPVVFQQLKFSQDLLYVACRLLAIAQPANE